MHEASRPVRVAALRMRVGLLTEKWAIRSYSNRLQEWCQSRMRDGAQLVKELFAYDPDKRLTAAEALQHAWFQENPLPTRKYVEEGGLLDGQRLGY